MGRVPFTITVSVRGLPRLMLIWDAFPKKDGDAFVGFLQGGLFHGQGTYYWSCGMRYSGGFDRQFKNGAGKISFADGVSWFSSDNFSAVFPEVSGETDEDTLLPDPEGSRGKGILHHMVRGVAEETPATLETCGFEWKGSVWFEEFPLFRIQCDDGRVFAVKATSGTLEARRMIFRQGTWEFET